MNILVLDPANSTGYAVISLENNKADIYAYGFLDVPDCPYSGDQYICLASKIRDLIALHNVEEIAVEDYFFSGKFANGGTLNASYRAIVHLVAREHKLHYEILNISLWKKFINGTTTPTKQQKLQWGKEEAKKLMTQDSLWKRYGIRFANHSISEKTGKPIKHRSDIVDSVAMAVFYVKIYKQAASVACSVSAVDDVEWKKDPKGVFSYED